MRKFATVTSCFALSLAFGFVPPAASASPPDVCVPESEVQPLSLLRRASLDLRGRPPSFEEYESLRSADDPLIAAEAMISEMLVSEEFYSEVRRYHRNLLFGRINRALTSAFPDQRELQQDENGVFFINSMRRNYRRNWAHCLDQPQPDDKWDAEGRPQPIQTWTGPECGSDGTGICRAEGWVEVAPFWAPDTTVRICAYDAQDFEFGHDGRPCDLPSRDGGCGCGENLKNCAPGPEVRSPVRASIGEEGARLFEWIVREGRSYLDAFTTPMTVMDGRLVAYYRDLSGKALRHSQDIAYDADIASFPDLEFNDQSWVPVQRGPSHAGVLTNAGFMYRFASNRGRVNQFYTKFYCDPFVPSAEGLPAEELNPSPNLRERDGCADCHQAIEPAAAHFGRWRINASYGYMDATVLDFEGVLDGCSTCGTPSYGPCNDFCNANLVTAENSEAETHALYGGLPLTAAYATEADLANVEIGPAGLVDEPAEARAVAQCAVRTMAEHLLRRPIESTELAWIEEQTEAFVASGYDFRAMVAGLIADERYRMTR